MTIIKYHRERVRIKNDGRLRKGEADRLERKLLKKGWKNLQWSPIDHVGNDPSHKKVIHGLPPNYQGPCDKSSYTEGAIILLCDPKKRNKYNGEVMIKNWLDGPNEDGPRGIAWR